MIQLTQRKMLRVKIQTKRRYKKIAKQKDETKENDDTEDLSSTEDENEDGQSSNTHNDQDRSTEEVIDKMEDANIRCWIKTHKRMKWRIALKIASLPNERWIVEAALSSVQNTRHTEQLGDREEDGKTISTNSSNSKRMSLKTLQKATTNHGSKQQKTVEDGFYLKKTT